MAGNEVRIKIGAKDDASRPIRNIDDALARLQKRGAQGIIAGATATATFAAFSLISSGVRSLTDAIGDSVRMAIEDEASVKRLGAALKANVADWNGNTAAIDAQIAKRMELGFSDDALRGSLTRLVGATNDVSRALDIQATALDLARYKGIDLESATQALIKVEGGRYRLLAEMGIELRENATREEALAAVQRVAAGQAAEYADTTAGAMEAAAVAVGELQEDIGIGLSPVIKDLAIFVRTDVVPTLGLLVDALGEVAAATEWWTERLKDAAPGLRAAEDAAAALNAEINKLGRETSITRGDIEQANAAWDEAQAALASVAATTPRASDAMAIFGSTLANSAGWALALGNALRAVHASGQVEAVANIWPEDWARANTARAAAVPTPRAPRFSGGGGGGRTSARAAAVRVEFDEMRKAGREYIDSVHKQNQQVIDDAHRVARERIKASHEAARRQIDDDHKTASKAIEEAHRAANAEIAAERRTVSAKLAEQRRLNAAGISGAEQAQAAIENQRRERDLREGLAEAQASGDARAIRDAQEAMQSFSAQMSIEQMRVGQQLADEQAEAAAAQAEAELDERQAAEDARYESQKADEQAIYEGRVAAENATYEARMAAEDATYEARKAAEDARWKLVQDRFDRTTDALEKSKRANQRLADVETLRYLQERRRLLVAEGASRHAITNIDEQIAEVEKSIPKHAAGLWNVPKDGYLAFLHRNEMVLPAAPAAALRSGAMSATTSIAPGAIVINGAGRNAREIADEVMLRLQRRMRQQSLSSLVPR